MTGVLPKAFPSNLSSSPLPAKSKKKKLVAAPPRASTRSELVVEERDAPRSDRGAKPKRKRGVNDSNFAKAVGYGEENTGFRVKEKGSKWQVVEKKEKKVDEKILVGVKDMVLQEDEEESYLSDTRYSGVLK
jgi:hypothetical protein